MPRFDLAKRKARDLLRKEGVVAAPVPVEVLARRVDAEVRYQPFTGDLSGMRLLRDGRAIIGVNALDARVRQRFTIAHEIGHLLLHPDAAFHLDEASPIRFRNAKSSTGEDKAEVEANQFAAELLMPEAFLQRDIQPYIGRSAEDAIAELAESYDVSVQAMTIRLTALYYLR